MKLSKKGIRIFKTFNLYLCFITLGMCVAAPGPCLLDLQKLVHTDTNHIAFIYTARSTGYLLGSMIGGVILDLLKSKQAILTVFNFIIAASFIAVPWSGSLGALTGFMIINGAFLGAVDIGGNVVCLSLWGSDSGPFFQALHFTFGVGGLIAPLIAAPFLETREDFFLTLKNSTTTKTFTTEILFEKNNHTDGTVFNIVYPFSVIGAFGLLVTILFFVVCIMAPSEESKTKDQKKTDAPKPNMNILALVIFLNFVLLFVEMGTEIGYAQMLTAYAVKGPLHLTSSVGSYMTSTFWTAFTVSRLVSIFLAIKVDNSTLIISDVIIMSLGAAVLLFLKTHEWALWLSSVLLGTGVASFFPAAVGWLDTHIDVTNKIVSLINVGAAFGEMVIPFTITYYMDTVPEVLIYVVPLSCILSALLVYTLYMILRKWPKKIQKSAEVSDSICPLLHNR